MSDPLVALSTAWREHLLATRGRSGPSLPRQHVYASGRRDCVRWLALDMAHPEDQEAPSDDGMERMTRGTEIEHAKVARLLQIGPRCSPPFEVIEGQRYFQIHDRDGVLIISGKIDGRLRFEGVSERPVFEVKSGVSVQRIETIEDFDRSPWTRHMLDQLLVYLLELGEPWGFFIIDRPGLPAFVRVRLEDHLGRAESFLREAREAVDAAAGRVPLPPMVENLTVCRRCSHLGKSCHPPVDFGPGLQIIDDPELASQAQVLLSTEEAAAAHASADKALKKALRGCELGLLGGEFMVEGKWGPHTSYDVPDDVKAPFKKVNPKGSFRLSVSRIESGAKD